MLGRCQHCDHPLEVAPDGPTAVVAGAVRAEIERVPRVRCPAGHGSRPLPGRLVARVAEAATDGVPAAGARLLRRHDGCTACGAPLSMLPRRTRRSVPVTIPELPLVTVTFELPMTRCPDCGTEQATADAGSRLDAATRAALAADPVGEPQPPRRHPS